MKQIIIIILILFSFLSVSAQKEVYFNTTKPEDIKVESMHGFEIGSAINASSLFNPYYSYGQSFGIPLSMGYFNEKRINPSWTLTTRIGLGHGFMNLAHYIFVKDSFPMNDTIQHFISQKFDHYKFEYSLSIGISVEPRWYFGYKKRYQIGHAKLNSGWFLSLPFSVSTTLINTYKPDWVDIYSSNFRTYCSLDLTPTLGFRQAISNHWFLEGNCQLINASSHVSSYNSKYFYVTIPWFTIFPGINIKAAYTFK